MKVTNRLGLPEPIVEAIRNSGYSPGESDITVTGLIEPVQIHALKEKHKDEIQEDASDLIYSLQGQSIHTILERAGQSLKEGEYIIEKRFYHTFRGWKLGGQIDLYDVNRALLQDYKLTSVYSVKGGAKEEYAQQLNVNAELLRRNGYKVKQLQIVAILRDWSKGEYQREATRCKDLGIKCGYPSNQVVLLDVELIDSSIVVKFIEEQITAHKQGRESAKLGAQLQECTPEERWAREDKFAVIKKGQKRAVRLFDSYEAAEAYKVEHKLHDIELRRGESIRCESYCSVKQWCNQYKNMKKEQ